MAQKMLEKDVTPIQAYGVSSEYSIKCAPDITTCVRKTADNYSVTIQKGRLKLEVTIEEWRSIVANCDAIELGFLLMSGNLGRVSN